jgi:hypothetical protein
MAKTHFALVTPTTEKRAVVRTWHHSGATNKRSLALHKAPPARISRAWKRGVLIPASILTAVVAPSIGVTYKQSPWSAALIMMVAVVALDTGYLIGVASRAVTITTGRKAVGRGPRGFRERLSRFIHSWDAGAGKRTRQNDAVSCEMMFLRVPPFGFQDRDQHSICFGDCQQ